MEQYFSVDVCAQVFNDPDQAKAYLEDEGGVLYTWTCYGIWNHLELGVSNMNALGYVVLPEEWPDDMPLPSDEAQDFTKPEQIEKPVPFVNVDTDFDGIKSFWVYPSKVLALAESLNSDITIIIVSSESNYNIRVSGTPEEVAQRLEEGEI